MGRRIGKSLMIAVECIWKTCTNSNFKVIYVAPYESQCEMIFGMMNRLLEGSIMTPVRNVRKPYIMEFANGSYIRGYTANVRAVKKGSTIRGAEANHIVVDEMDFGMDEIVNEILMPIYIGNDKCTITAASTPTGRRGIFYTWCTKAKELGMREFYAPAYISPRWTKESEKLAKATMTRDQYVHEVCADFGVEMEGVYRNSDLLEVMKPYTYDSLKYKSGNRYVMGVDWNEQYGVRIVINEVLPDGTVRLFLHEKVEKQDFIQTVSVAKIIDIQMNEVKCDFIYVDKGYGQCVGKDTLVYTSKGVKKIIDVNNNDMVMTYNGTFQKVLNKVVRQDSKESYSLVPYKCLHTTISSCHPFLVYRKCGTNVDEEKLQWVKCPDINIKTDYIAISKTKKVLNSDVHIIDLYELLKHEFVNLKFDNKHIWLEGSSCINRYINILSEDFQRVYAWYLSEGICTKCSVKFIQCVDSYEAELRYLKQSILNIFPGISVSYVKLDNLVYVTINGKLISKMFEIVGGKTESAKFICSELLKHPKKLETFIESLTYGKTIKGCVGDEISSTSSSFMFQLRQIFIDSGILPEIYSNGNSNVYTLFVSNGYKLLDLFYSTRDKLQISDKKCIETDNYFFVPIKRLDYIGNIESLVDIQVENTESFCGNGIVLHNTQIELLRNYGLSNPNSNMEEILKPVDYNGMLDIRDPITGGIIPKPTKP